MRVLCFVANIMLGSGYYAFGREYKRVVMAVVWYAPFLVLAHSAF